MYQSYPSAGQAPEPVRPGPPPSVVMAVRLMYAGAVVSGLSLIVGLATVGSLRSSLHKAGRSWARIVSTVLFGLDTLFLLLGVARAGAAGGTLVSILTWLIGLGTIIFLWRKDSSAYFAPQAGQ